MSSQNVATTLVYMAYNTSTGAYQTADASNHTLKLVKDGTEAAPTNSPSEVDSTNTPGAYKLALTAAETQFGTVWLGGKSSTANVIIVPITVTFEILPTALDANGMVKADVEDITGTALSTHASGMMPSDVRDIAGAAVSTSSAQLGVNVVNVAGGAAAIDGNNRIKVDVEDWGGAAVSALPANFFSLAIDGSGNVNTTSNIKKNTIQNGFTFVMTDSTTHLPKTGLTVAATRSIDGAAFASTTNLVSEVASGTYTINLSASDTNGNHIMLRFTSAGADDLNIAIVTQP